MKRVYVLCVIIVFLVNGLLAIRCPSVAFVVHSNNNNDDVTKFMSETFLYDTNLVIVTGHDSKEATVSYRRRLRQRRVLKVRKVAYDGNPGGRLKTFRTGGGKYLGTHRTMAGVLMATDYFPEAEWIYVLDDDNVINVDSICETLAPLNSSIPLLLGSVGEENAGT